MSNSINFHTQLTSIMEILTKAAVAEITKLVDESYAVLRFQVYRCQNEKDLLKRKLQLAERELRVARGARAHGCSNENLPVGLQVYGCLSEGGADYGEKPPFDQKLFVKDCDPQCTSEGGEQVTQPTPVEDGKKPDTEPTPAGDPVELSEQHRCEHSDEELSGLEFVVKAEQEEEHVAQRLDQTGCERSAGRLNNLGSEYVMYERDSQLWTSFTQEDSDIETDDPVCSNTTAQCSQNLSIHTQLQHAPATMEVSGNTLSSFGPSYVEEFDKMSEKPSVCREDLRSEAIHTQQGQYRERLVHTVERENQTLLPQQQQHGPSVKHMRGSESPAQLHSGSQYETSSTLSSSAFSAGKKGKTDGQADFGKKPYICTHCGKGFAYFSCYKVHLRSHTGEKPYGCAQCGKRFTQQSNLTKHESVHGGNKPFDCSQCGKSFRYRSILTLHLRIHSGERPFHCAQCGKSFAQSSHFKRHQRSHMGKKPYGCF
ncbi:zinc finger protein 585B-like [Anguilla anguilla]|uniref:zinc finger protein 585B-like n=1 Tax=Anguilla anguilla TaxID=7936 RepID=UPI0015ACFF95|nr:zinc finger protein 585B-like [Anguilla anguilla]